MNTDTVRFDDAVTALASCAEAKTMLELGHGLGLLGQALNLPTYALLMIDGVGARLREVCHNVEPSEAMALLSHPLILELLAREVPLAIPDATVGLGIPDLANGIAVVMPHDAMSCVLLLGRSEGALTEGTMSQSMGLALTAATHAISRLRSFVRVAPDLSERALECLRCAAAGMSAKDTARRLGISPRTVEEYILRCRKRLDAKSTFAAVVTAIRLGWITHEQMDVRQV